MNYYEQNFLRPKCTVQQLDLFIIRKAILKALSAQLNNLQGELLDIGCGQMPYKSLLTSPQSQVSKYIGLDFKDNPIHSNDPDITWQEGKIPLSDHSIDCAIATEVLEHCPNPEEVMKEINRVLKPGGFFFFTVPFLWPLHEVPFDEYRYTPFSLKRHLHDTGFTNIQLAALGGWDASLAQMMGLWVRRRKMGKWKKGVLSLMLMPLIYLLNQKNNLDPIKFWEGTMITGLSGTARKHKTSMIIDPS